MLTRLQWIFLLDTTLLICACALQAVNFTGLFLHEWLGLATAVMILPHLLIAWNWIASTTPRVFSRGPGAAPNHTRLNYVLTLALFACITAQIYSGIMISQQAIPPITGKPAIPLESNFSWDHLHTGASNYSLALICFHLAINWNWLLAAVRTRLGWRKAEAG